MRKNFVTIDLDYWTILNEYDKAHTNYLEYLIEISKVSRVVRYHHHVVTKRLIPKDTEIIYNIDFHNDVVDVDPTLDLNEGTWGNFIPKAVKEFVWIYPDKTECIRRREGICIGNRAVPKITHVKYTKLETIAKLNLDHIDKLVICTSPNWASHPIAPYNKFLRRYGYKI
jgi:hypothetical protein